MMTFVNNLKRCIKGIKQYKTINKYKIDVILERPGLGYAAFKYELLNANKLKASIPAAAIEFTSLIYTCTKQIYSVLTSTKKIIGIRRFMRKSNEGQLEPTRTVSITLSYPTVPNSVDLNSWRFEVRPCTPLVKQCLKCLRYNHIAKF